MRHDDDMAYRCGAQAAGYIVAASLALMLIAVGIVGFWVTGEQGYK